MDMEALNAPVPRDMVKWRAQQLVERDGKHKSLALAYVDARCVMDRLDDICGHGGWQDSYVETPRGRVICTLSIRVDGEWVAKSDGAGDSDVEGEKGGISDAFKRAAVKWGIARELYSLGNVWAPCTVNTRGKWKAWVGNPWDHVKAAPVKAPPVKPMRPKPDPANLAAEVAVKLEVIKTINNMPELAAFWKGLEHAVQAAPEMIKAKDDRKAAIEQEAKE